MIRYTVVSILSWVFLAWQCPLLGQDTLFIHAQAQSEKGKLKIRWAPSHASLWVHTNQVGFEIERVTIKDQQGQLLPPKQRLASAKKWGPIIPSPAEDWEKMTDTSEVAGMGASALFGEGIEVEQLSSHPMIRTYQESQSTEMRFGFGLLAADQDWQVATAMGLALEDDQIVENQTYLYSIYPAQRPTSILVEPAHLIIKAIPHSELPIPSGLTANFGDKLVHLQWDANLTPSYGSYWLEKSLDGGQQFVFVNTVPIIPSSQQDQEQLLAFCRDTLTENFQRIVYRIRGKTIFGQMSPPSDTVSGFGKPKRLEAALGITRIEEVGKQTLKISWDFPPEFNQHLEGFAVYRSPKKQGPFLQINPQDLKATVRSFTDYSPYQSGYYQVIAKDLYGHSYASFSSLGQLADHTPPAPPTNLLGTLDQDGKIRLSWSPNIEDDLMGYRVFRSNQKEGYYNQVTSYFTRDTFYNHTIDLNTISSSIYFKVIALDYRENYSEKSIFCEVKIPDLIPPISPVMRRALPQEGSIVLFWNSSSSQDIVLHEIQRKKSHEEDWKTIFTWLEPDHYNHYEDSTIQDFEIYDYRIIARDDSDLQSSSKVITISSLDKGNRAAIEEFQAFLTNPSSEVHLQWKYPQSPSLYQFVIYRSTGNGPLSTIDILRIDQRDAQQDLSTSVFQSYEYMDTKIQDQKIYQYQVIAKHKDGGQSPLSATRIIRVQ